jgi:hypothetical protein
MQIALRNITYEPRLSQETSAFVGEVFIDGRHVGTADNDGRGSQTRVQIQPPRLRKMAEAFCQSLPPCQFPAAYGAEAFEVPMDLPLYIDLLLEQHIERRLESGDLT